MPRTKSYDLLFRTFLELSGYQSIADVNSGIAGKVIHAKHVQSGRTVALKMPLPTSKRRMDDQNDLYDNTVNAAALKREYLLLKDLCDGFYKSGE